MVLLTDRIQKRLTMQVEDIGVNTTAIRSLDWERTGLFSATSWTDPRLLQEVGDLAAAMSNV